jgi:hypothetical protein
MCCQPTGGIDQDRERLAVGFLAHVPSGRRMPVPTRLWSIGRSRYVPSAASAGRSRAITSTAECGRDGVRRGDLDDAVSRCASATSATIGAMSSAATGWNRDGRKPDDISIRTFCGDAAEEFQKLGRVTPVVACNLLYSNEALRFMRNRLGQ